jgi:predicted small lipoprotein YifL
MPPPADSVTPNTQALLARVQELEALVRDLEDELRRAQSSINVEIDLGDLEASEPATSSDVENAWRKVRRDPANPEALRELAETLKSTGQTDRRLFVTQALCALGEASPEEQKWVEEQRDIALPRPNAGLSHSAWSDQLLHPDQEVTTGNIFGVIAPAVLLGKVAALGRDGALYKPTADQRQDPEQTTVTAVRALAWAAAILGVGIPVVIVDPKCAGSYVHTAALPPMTLVAHSALSGRAQRELAFMAGRHLTMYRVEHYVRTLFPSVADLEDLFLAAVTLGNPTVPLSVDVKHRVGPIAAALEPLLQPAQIDALRGHLLRFVEEGGRTNLQRWGAAVDKTACRAGLLLCGDLNTAAEVLKKEEGPNGELFRDLIAFATSEAHAKLRAQLGIGSQN